MTDTNAPAKPVLALAGEDGNAFFIMGRWQRAAEQAGWTKPQIEAVLDDCMSGDYDHLLQVIVANSIDPQD